MNHEEILPTAPAEESTQPEEVAPAPEGAAEALTPEEIIAQLEAELAETRAEAAGHLDQFQRLAAEFQNSKRRQEKLVSEAIERASAHIILRLLPIVDDLDLAFRRLPVDLTEEQNAWVDGFRQIQKKLAALLEENEVSAIPTDGPFDPSHHEAVTSEPSDTVESGHIIATLRVGYAHKGRVLRPALVRVAM